jgi:endo-1,4-beta-xylanase
MPNTTILRGAAVTLAATLAATALGAQPIRKDAPTTALGPVQPGEACVYHARQGPSDPKAAAAAPVALKDAFKNAFLVGAAINTDQIYEKDPGAVALIARQFAIVSPEDVLKWECVHPGPGQYAFQNGDAYVAFAERHGLKVIGHTLVWHSQVPRWVFVDSAGNPLGRDALLARMKGHIDTVVGRYKGRIMGWDVVNEALNEDGTLRDSPWKRGIGDDYIVKAFQFAHAADPNAELYYNDYSLENPAKRDGVARLVRQLKAAGVPITAVGTQEHLHMDWPTAAGQDSMFKVISAEGVKVNVTELDIDVLPRAVRGNSADVAQRAALQAAQDPYTAGLPDSVQTALANRYAEVFRVYMANEGVIDRVTFWGVRDGDSWLNMFPVRGRTNYPLLFDRAGKPKPAFEAVVKTAR